MEPGEVVFVVDWKSSQKISLCTEEKYEVAGKACQEYILQTASTPQIYLNDFRVNKSIIKFTTRPSFY